MKTQQKHDAAERHRAQAHPATNQSVSSLTTPLGFSPPVQRMSARTPVQLKDTERAQQWTIGNHSFRAGSMATFQLKMAVLQQQPKPAVTGTTKDSEKLKNLVNSLFKAAPAGGAAIGDGSALAACAHEKNGGAKVGGADHQDKCTQVLNGINNLITRSKNAKVIQSGSQLSAADLLIATKLKADLTAALDGTYTG